MRALARFLRLAIGLPVIVVALYGVAAIAGGFIPAEPQRQQLTPPDVAIFVFDNGIHTSLVLPRLQATESFLPPTAASPDFPGPVADYPWLMVSWGDRDFFLNTPTWSEVRPKTVLTALVGSGQSLVHIDRLKALPDRSALRAIKFGYEDFAALQDWLKQQVSLSAVPLRGYSSEDRFYDSPRDDYSVFFNCNNWTSEALSVAGVKTGLWTPLPFGIMHW